ncbi:MAG TPA: hypothetical protein VFV67_07495 [Actinophytocola sp.]|nr:hypothetical protein [Actinophytocola sp.]
MTISNGRIAGAAIQFAAAIWNTAGHLRRVLPGVSIFAMNGHGHLLARAAGSGPWFIEEEDGHRVELPTDFSPAPRSSLTNDGVVVGHSRNHPLGTPVMWRRV